MTRWVFARCFAALLLLAELASGKLDLMAGRALAGSPDVEDWVLADGGKQPKLLSPEGLMAFESGFKANLQQITDEVRHDTQAKIQSSQDLVQQARAKFEVAASVILKESFLRARKLEDQMQALSVATSHGMFNGKTTAAPIGKCCCAQSEEEAECAWHNAAQLEGRLNKFQCPNAAPFEYTDLVKATIKNSTSFIDARKIDKLLEACARSPAWQERISGSQQLDEEATVASAEMPEEVVKASGMISEDSKRFKTILEQALAPLTGEYEAPDISGAAVAEIRPETTARQGQAPAEHIRGPSSSASPDRSDHSQGGNRPQDSVGHGWAPPEDVGHGHGSGMEPPGEQRGTLSEAVDGIDSDSGSEKSESGSGSGDPSSAGPAGGMPNSSSRAESKSAEESPGPGGDMPEKGSSDSSWGPGGAGDMPEWGSRSDSDKASKSGGESESGGGTAQDDLGPGSAMPHIPDDLGPGSAMPQNTPEVSSSSSDGSNPTKVGETPELSSSSSSEGSNPGPTGVMPSSSASSGDQDSGDEAVQSSPGPGGTIPQDKDNEDALLAVMKAVQAGVGGVSNSITAVKSEIANLNKRVEALEHKEPCDHPCDHEASAPTPVAVASRPPPSSSDALEAALEDALNGASENDSEPSSHGDEPNNGTMQTVTIHMSIAPSDPTGSSLGQASALLTPRASVLQPGIRPRKSRGVGSQGA